MALECCTQRGAARASGAKYFGHVIQSQEAQVFRLRQGAAHLRQAHDPCDVEQRQSRWSHREAVVPHAFEAPLSVHPHIR